MLELLIQLPHAICFVIREVVGMLLLDVIRVKLLVSEILTSASLAQPIVMMTVLLIVAIMLTYGVIQISDVDLSLHVILLLMSMSEVPNVLRQFRLHLGAQMLPVQEKPPDGIVAI